MEALGKITFKFATKDDQLLVQEFCNSQNFSNNISLEKMKWDWCLENGAWTIAQVNNNIVSIAGIHTLPEVSPNAYRCLFRGAQLPGYTLGVGRNIFKTGIQLAYLLNMQLDWGLEKDPTAQFYISTNINDDGGKSQRMNNVIMPLMAKTGVWSLERQMTLYSVPQNIWRVDVNNYKTLRAAHTNSVLA